VSIPAEPAVVTPATAVRTVWRGFAWLVRQFNILTGYLSAVIIVITAGVVCYGVIMRYYFASPLDWGLELSIFMLIVSTFMSAGYTQLQRGHVTIEIMDHILSARANRVRYLVGDLLSLLFCAFVAWNAWKYFHEAYSEGWVTESLWAPKMWIPYLFMAIGMSALSMQLLVQTVEALPVLRGMFAKKVNQ
jgi:TRAP-type C4-dicarboxylate transport system permease small subunit